MCLVALTNDNRCALGATRIGPLNSRPYALGEAIGMERAAELIFGENGVDILASAGCK